VCLFGQIIEGDGVFLCAMMGDGIVTSDADNVGVCMGKDGVVSCESKDCTCDDVRSYNIGGDSVLNGIVFCDIVYSTESFTNKGGDGVGVCKMKDGILSCESKGFTYDDVESGNIGADGVVSLCTALYHVLTRVVIVLRMYWYSRWN